MIAQKLVLTVSRAGKVSLTKRAQYLVMKTTHRVGPRKGDVAPQYDQGLRAAMQGEVNGKVN